MENLLQRLTSALFGAFQSPSAAPRTFAACTRGSRISFNRSPFVHHFYNEEGDEVYTGQSLENKVTYGFITCHLAKPLSDLMLAEQRLFLFLESLHPHFEIECTTGLDHGLSHPVNPDVVGMTEYWQDAKGYDWKVQAWTDGSLMAVTYVRNINITDFRKQDAFLDSFAFPSVRNLV
ncbi:hypothetical protein [Flaviaesturariibacter amylovorans]|uniref:Uncharacterized protein n=1 Tax=Flaviaesturariibacter amylovorans TaxID=1084520 RepID=A0ABP8GW58_9BACT